MPPLSIALFVPIIASIWPTLKEQAASFQELLKNPIYKAFLGQVVDISTWQGVYFMYIFVWMEWILIFASIFFPVRIISREVEKKTLDIALSYPHSPVEVYLRKVLQLFDFQPSVSNNIIAVIIFRHGGYW